MFCIYRLDLPQYGFKYFVFTYIIKYVNITNLLPQMPFKKFGTNKFIAL